MEQQKDSRIKSTKYIYAMCLNASLGIFFQGYNQGVFNVIQLAILELKDQDEDSRAFYSALMSSPNPLGGLIGALLAGYILTKFKTIKRTFFFLDILGIIATSILLSVAEYPNIVIGRFIQGFVQGMNMALVPVYIREFSPLEILGKTASFVQLGQKGGLLSGYLFGLILPTKKWFKDLKDQPGENYDNEYEWRIVLCVPILFALLRIIGFLTCFGYDTPTDLLEKHHEEELEKFLHLVYKEKDFDDVYQQTLKKFHEIELRKKEQGITDEEKIQQQKEKGRKFLEQTAKENNEQNIEKEEKDSQKNDNTEKPASNNEQDENHNNHHQIISDHHLATMNENQNHDQQFLNIQQIKLHQISEEVVNKIAHPIFDPNELTESQMIREEQEFERVEKATRFRRRMLGWTISLTVSFSGIDAIFFYSNKIFEDGGIDEYATIITICIGISTILFSFVGMAAVDSAGRRPLLIGGSYLMCLGLIGIVVGDSVDQISLLIGAIAVSMFGYNSTLGPIKWACYVELMDEFGVSVAASMIYFFQFIIALVFPFMVDGMGIGGAFAVFLGLSIYCLVYLTIELKETKGKTKAEIYPMFERKQIKKQIPKFTTNANILEIQGRSQIGLSFRGRQRVNTNEIHKSFRKSIHQSIYNK